MSKEFKNNWAAVVGLVVAMLQLMIVGGSIAAAPPTITSIEGYLDEKNVDQFWKLISENLDHIVRLKIEVADTGSTVARLGQPDGISPSRMAEMLEVDKAGRKVRC
jgi:hypothetical protein